MTCALAISYPHSQTRMVNPMRRSASRCSSVYPVIMPPIGCTAHTTPWGTDVNGEIWAYLGELLFYSAAFVSGSANISPGHPRGPREVKRCATRTPMLSSGELSPAW